MNIVVAAVNILSLVSLCFILWKRDQSSIKKFFWPAVFAKWMAGILVGLVYTFYYSAGDTFQYFQDGVKLADLARDDIGAYVAFLWSADEGHKIMGDLVFRQPRALFLSKATSFFCLLTWDNYWVISLYFSTASFLTGWILVRKIASAFPEARAAAVIGFLFFPSIVFWSSGLIKESGAMAALFYLSYIFLRAWQSERISILQGLGVVISLWLLWNLKYYYLAIFLPVTVTSLITRMMFRRIAIDNLLLKVLIWFIVFALPVFMVSMLHPNFDPGEIMHVIVLNYEEFHAISAPEDVIHYRSLTPTVTSMILNSPWAVFSGLFRPFLWESGNVLQVLIALENVVLLTLVAFAILHYKRVFFSSNRLLIFTAMIYVLLLCAFLALSTPNFGTLSRYRVGFMPFLIVLLMTQNRFVNILLSLKIFSRVV